MLVLREKVKEKLEEGKKESPSVIWHEISFTQFFNSRRENSIFGQFEIYLV